MINYKIEGLKRSELKNKKLEKLYKAIYFN